MNPISLLFPVLAVVISVVAYLTPELFAPYRGAIVPLLTIIMFAMGLTLKPKDFQRVLTRPKVVGIGVALQYSVMPLAAFAIGHAMNLPVELIAGLVLLGASPGGTASNVMCYLAKADVALSVSLTMVSTLLAIVMTPALTWLLVGQSIPVDAWGMLWSLVRIVLIPIVLGIGINTFFGRFLKPVKFVLPGIATAAILCAIAIVVALNQGNLASAGFAIVAAVVLHNGCGLLFGYWVPRLIGYDRMICRTLAFETGMQNSGLSVALALNYFSALAALPGAIFSIWHNLTGAILASIWSSKDSGPVPAKAGD
ncbi:MAG: bile acid:sodium symporter family protein [Alphaproteobacteria bacterium]|nr:bile acid:sodium symporter family protein [Alphaproteobacteria bacterium]